MLRKALPSAIPLSMGASLRRFCSQSNQTSGNLGDGVPKSVSFARKAFQFYLSHLEDQFSGAHKLTNGPFVCASGVGGSLGFASVAASHIDDAATATFCGSLAGFVGGWIGATTAIMWTATTLPLALGAFSYGVWRYKHRQGAQRDE